MAISVGILPPKDLYQSDPQRTELGRRILTGGLLLMNRIGLEDFTFRKLSVDINSSEASIYRYFSNKNQLLHYYTSWYWEWMSHLIGQAVMQQRDPVSKLKAAISVLVKPYSGASGAQYIDQSELRDLIIKEGTKSYRTIRVDRKNSKGLYLGYKKLTEQIADLIVRVDPTFSHPKALASSVFEMAHDHPFFARHLPRLTDLKNDDKLDTKLENMLWQWTEKLLTPSRHPVDSERLPSPFTVFISRDLKADSPLSVG